MGSGVTDRLVSSRAGQGLITMLERAEPRRSGLLRVLTYHRVPDAAIFEQHLRYLTARHCIVTVDALLEAMAGGAPLPPRAVLITFDDAYRDVGDIAWPALRALGLSAAVFVPTAYPDRADRGFWWDRLELALADTPRRDEIATPVGPLPLADPADRARACARLKRHLKTLHHDEVQEQVDALYRRLDPTSHVLPAVLGWDDLRRLAREGLAIGGHTRSHPFLNRVSQQEARREILGSIEDLHREIGATPPIFSYPDGRYSPAAVNALREGGIAAAFTTRRGTNDLRTADPMLLRRINVSRTARLPVLQARLVHSSVYLNLWRRWFDPQPRSGAHV